MLYILGFIILGVALALWLPGLSFSNPYKLYIVFGKKGSGKSTGFVRCMLRDLRHGWTVYTNMRTCTLPGIRYINPQDLAEFRPESDSSIYIDEAHLLWDNRKFKSFPDGLSEFYSYQRQFRTKIYLASQAYDVDLKIRNRADALYIADNYFGWLTIWRRVSKSFALTAPIGDSDSRIADGLKFTLPIFWQFFDLRKYVCWFESFSPPSRKLIPYEPGLSLPPAFLAASERSLAVSAVRRDRRKMHQETRRRKLLKKYFGIVSDK